MRKTMEGGKRQASQLWEVEVKDKEGLEPDCGVLLILAASASSAAVKAAKFAQKKYGKPHRAFTVKSAGEIDVF